jgi:hypothetical protein
MKLRIDEELKKTVDGCGNMRAKKQAFDEDPLPDPPRGRGGSSPSVYGES